MVLIHGNAGYLQDFQFGTLDLIAQHYQVVAFDLPGHGLSQMPKKALGTIEEVASILHDAVIALGLKDPILVGHSWGGSVALAYALHYPHDVSGLVLLAPAAYPDHRREMQLEGLLNTPLLGDALISIVKPFIGRKLLKHSLKEAFYPDKVPEEYLDAATSVWLGRKQIKACIKNDQALELSLSRQRRLYENIHTPVIIVTGDSDRMLSAEGNAIRLHKAITQSKLVIIPHTGHQIPQTHPEVVLRAIQMTEPTSNIAAN